MFCYKCGQELQKEAKFCSYCGTKILQIEKIIKNEESLIDLNEKEQKIEAKQSDTKQNEEKIQKSSGKKTYKIITGIVVFLAFIAPSITRKELLLLDGVINSFIWLGIFFLISFFIFPRTKLDQKEIKTPINNKDGNKSVILDDSEKPIFNVGPSFIWVYIFIFLIIFLLIAIFGI